jgi:carboxypeptidase C (cathepsin A)
MKNKLLLILILTAYFGIALAQDAKKEESKTNVAVPKAESSVTSHQVKIDGNTIRYKAVAGTTILKNDNGDPLATFGYTAYLKEGVINYVQSKHGMAFDGVILVSPFLNFSVGVDGAGEDLPHDG